jgi:hypothetical protein
MNGAQLTTQTLENPVFWLTVLFIVGIGLIVWVYGDEKEAKRQAGEKPFPGHVRTLAMPVNPPPPPPPMPSTTTYTYNAPTTTTTTIEDDNGAP